MILLTYIYIPLWLDLLFFFLLDMQDIFDNLHSTMIRFIMRAIFYRIFYQLDIYIPLWLDLLFRTESDIEALHLNLHSTMVRFIIDTTCGQTPKTKLFTFHYG